MKTVELILHFWIHADKDGDFSSNDIDIFEITGSKYTCSSFRSFV